MPILRFARRAAADIADILDRSETAFGTVGRLRYERLIETGLRDLADEPDRVGAIRRDEFGPGVRTYHLIHSRERARSEHGIVHRPRHVIVFRLIDPDLLHIGRILHDAMDFERHLPAAYLDPTRSEDEGDA